MSMDTDSPPLFLPERKRSPFQKILSQEQLSWAIDIARKRGLSIVTTNGTFDLLHVGHMKALRYTSQLADILVVGINSDASVKAYKYPDRPIIPQQYRAYQVATMECVDLVCVFDGCEIGGPLLELVRPNVHTTGSNWYGHIPEQAIADELGIPIHIVPPFQDDDGTTWSTTEIIGRITRLEK
jgi:rfaE bifunctional protein nucleotidyltransferase chain/domain